LIRRGGQLVIGGEGEVERENGSVIGRRQTPPNDPHPLGLAVDPARNNGDQQVNPPPDPVPESAIPDVVATQHWLQSMTTIPNQNHNSGVSLPFTLPTVSVFIRVSKEIKVTADRCEYFIARVGRRCLIRQGVVNGCVQLTKSLKNGKRSLERRSLL
jgi:hypothetical protein